MTVSPFLNRRLKIARIEAELTQVQLAQKAKLKQKSISNYETGKADPTLATLCKLATILRKPYIYFLDTSYESNYH